MSCLHPACCEGPYGFIQCTQAVICHMLFSTVSLTSILHVCTFICTLEKRQVEPVVWQAHPVLRTGDVQVLSQMGACMCPSYLNRHESLWIGTLYPQPVLLNCMVPTRYVPRKCAGTQFWDTEAVMDAGFKAAGPVGTYE